MNVDNYNKEFGRYLQIDQSNLVTGAIYLGNNYAKSNDYYGGYQGNYLKRIKALFPDAKDILHLYAGQVNDEHLKGDKVDINPQSDDTIYADARELSKYLDKKLCQNYVQDLLVLLADVQWSTTCRLDQIHWLLATHEIL